LVLRRLTLAEDGELAALEVDLDVLRADARHVERQHELIRELHNIHRRGIRYLPASRGRLLHLGLGPVLPRYRLSHGSSLLSCNGVGAWPMTCSLIRAALPLIPP